MIGPANARRIHCYNHNCSCTEKYNSKQLEIEKENYCNNNIINKNRINKEPLLYKNNRNSIQRWSQEVCSRIAIPYPIYCPKTNIIINPPPSYTRCTSPLQCDTPTQLDNPTIVPEKQPQNNKANEAKDGIQLFTDAINILDSAETTTEVGETNNIVGNGYEEGTENLLLLATVAIERIEHYNKTGERKDPGYGEGSSMKQQMESSVNTQRRRREKRKMIPSNRNHNKRLSNVTFNLKLHLKSNRTKTGPRLRINGIVV